MKQLLAIAIVAIASTTLRASLIVPADLPTLVHEAQTIVLGRVTGVRGVIRPGTRRVDSYITFAVDQSLKGPGETALTFKTLGGVSGRYRTVVHGSPVFSVGDEAVLFLGRGSTPYPIGLTQGVFRVRRDRLTGDRRILPPPMLIDPRQTMTIRRGDGTRAPIAVEAFTAIVRSHLTRRQP
jgi:hypothetical protein